MSAATACWTSGPRTWPSRLSVGKAECCVLAIFGRPRWCLLRGRDRCADFVRAPVADFPLSAFARSAAQERMPALKPNRTCSRQLRAPPWSSRSSQPPQSPRSSPVTSHRCQRAGSRRRQNSFVQLKRSRLSNALPLSGGRPSAADRPLQRLVRRHPAFMIKILVHELEPPQ